MIVTLGADDIHFVDIVTFCATGYARHDADEVETIAGLRDPGERIRANYAEKFPTLEALAARPPRLESSYCTAKNPGAVIESEFWDPINSGEIAAHYVDLVTAIRARGQAPARCRASSSPPTTIRCPGRASRTSASTSAISPATRSTISAR